MAHKKQAAHPRTARLSRSCFALKKLAAKRIPATSVVRQRQRYKILAAQALFRRWARITRLCCRDGKVQFTRAENRWFISVPGQWRSEIARPPRGLKI